MAIVSFFIARLFILQWFFLILRFDVGLGFYVIMLFALVGKFA